jgi:DNA topoisomerase II
MDFLENFKVSNVKEEIIKKSMWAGSIKRTTVPDLLGLNSSNEIIEIKNDHTPALLKSIDEIVVNAVDHCKGCENTKKKVTKIHVTFNKESKEFSVFNDGPGIPISKNKENKYLIELAFSEPFAGTNIDKPAESIKGGVNGLGAKITNIHSESFIVETVYKKNKYIQVFKNRLNMIGIPLVTPVTEDDYTLITFIPSFYDLDYKKLTNSLLDDLDNWLRLRMYQVSMYTSIEIKYNDITIEPQSVYSIAKLLSMPDDIILSTIAKNNINSHSLHIAVSCSTGKIKKKTANMGIINGVVSNKGNHITYIRSIIKNYIETKVSKLTRGSSVDNRDLNIRIVVSGSIPGLDWSSQSKDTILIDNKILENYKISEIFLKNIVDSTLCTVIDKQNNSKKEKVIHDKYKKARNIDSKFKHQCYLLAAEGDSAMGVLTDGLTQECNKKCDKSKFSPSFDWLGIISLQGVVINAAKEITEIDQEGLSSIIVKSDKLKNNKRLNMLADAFGLDYNCKYSTPKELNTLKYGKLVICTDQDLDGIGKICSLVLVWIYTFWPKLIENGKVCKLMTPVIRIYENDTKKNPIKEFYYESELDDYLSTNKKKTDRIKYYKGLAAHNDSEVQDMFKLDNFVKNIYTYTIDDVTNELFNVYFGPDSNLRKKALVHPVKHLTLIESKELKRKQEIPIGKVQLDIDTKLYKNEAINRQLPHAIDGLNPARRKVLAASIIRFGQESKEVKVFQLAGYVADKMLYHHGDMSLNKTIITMAQNFIGARKYPYLIGIGQFGNRHGTKAGSPRYISVKLNPIVNILFPPEDKWLLKYTFDEGVQAEPEYYVPILPMSVLESYQIVTEGWNHKTYGRNLKSVVDLVINMINETDYTDKIEFSNTSLTIDGDIRQCEGVEYSFGKYVYYELENKIHITDLPIGIVTCNFIESVSKMDKFIEKIDDYSSTNEIDIHIYLKPDTINVILNKYGNAEIDSIEDCFKLRNSLKPNLNYYSCDKAVLEFKDYKDTVKYWFPVRKELYKQRLIRKEILQRINIYKEESIVKYINMSNELDLSSKENIDEVSKLLDINGFIPINSGLLHSPGYTPNDVLESLIFDTGSGANYDYILDIKERELTKKSIKEKINNINTLREKYEKTYKYLQESIPGSSLWLEEIQSFLKKCEIK